jgi:hypothetical protein
MSLQKFNFFSVISSWITDENHRYVDNHKFVSKNLFLALIILFEKKEL